MPGKVVLITGATGVVGSALVPLFLQEPDTEVRLLLRARSADHLQERVDELLEFWAPEFEVDQAMLARIKPLRGDVSEPMLGLAEGEYQRLAGELTHIVHSAANVKMNMSAEEARKSSVVSATGIAELAERCQRNGQFRKLEYVSTIGVAGRMTGLVPEAPLLDSREFHNTYESSKAEAERIILDKIESGLPVTIHRPSMVVGDSESGKIIHFQVFYHLCTFLTGRHTRGILPGLEGSCLDTIPVDYVARAIVRSSNLASFSGRILHLCSGPDQAIEMVELSDLVAGIFAQYEALPRTVTVPPWLFRSMVAMMSLFANRKGRRALGSLSLLLGYLAESRVQFFDNANTRDLLAVEGVPLPPAASYLESVLSYYLRSKPGQ